MKTIFNQFLSDTSGVTAVEYGVLSALISLVIISAVTSVGSHLKSTFSSVATSL